MKQIILITAALFIFRTTSYSQVQTKGQNKNIVNNADTVDVSSAKFIRIGNVLYNTEAFTKYKAVFLPLQNWYDVISIIDQRSYGTLSNSSVQAMLQFIAQQVPK